MITKLLNWLGGHGSGAAVDMHDPEPEFISQTEIDYNTLIRNIRFTKGDTYLLSEDDFNLIKEKSKQSPFVTSAFCDKNSLKQMHNERLEVKKFVSHPYKKESTIYGKRLIPNWPYKGRKTKRYYY